MEPPTAFELDKYGLEVVPNDEVRGSKHKKQGETDSESMSEDTTSDDESSKRPHKISSLPHRLILADPPSSCQGRKKKRAKRQGATTGSKHASVINVDDFNSTKESDGKSMLHAVEKKEHTCDYSGRHSPDGQTRKHWHNLTPVVKPGKEPNRWQFRCKYCEAYVSFACSILM